MQSCHRRILRGDGVGEYLWGGEWGTKGTGAPGSRVERRGSKLEGRGGKINTLKAKI